MQNNLVLKFRNRIKSFLSWFDQFLFADDHREQLGICRVLLCGTLFYMACFRQLNIDQLGENSMIPRDAALQIFPDFYRPAIQWFFWPDSMVGGIHLLLIGLLFLAMLGLTNRPLLLFTWILHQGILNRNYAILFGADIIGGLFLFYLSFTKCTDFFTIKNLIFKRTKAIISKPSFLSGVFFRILQIQLCTIYMYTGFEKLKGNSWWDGTALWTVFANPQFIQYDFKFLSHFPIVFAIGTFLSIIFEVYFAAMVLNKKTRPFWLVAGVLFHLGIGILLGLMTFSMVMISTYILFLRRESVLTGVNFIYKLLGKNRPYSVS